MDFSEGQTREQKFSISSQELSAFIIASGDDHPLHSDLEFAKQRGYRDLLLHGMCIAARCAKFLTYEFVGSYGLLVNINADFRSPVFVGEELLWKAEVIRVQASAKTVEVKWKVSNQSLLLIQRGTASCWISDT